MFIYNVTIKVTHAIATEWLQWLREEHIPEVTATGFFTHARILQLLEVDDSEGPTYAIQYFAESIEKYEQYIETFAGMMRQKSFEKWGDQFIAFRSIMKIVQ
ncbi:MAG TPA: DUF4286 family protein [Ferruginibacter sp.]|nr:DUF4286 family protein [Ferruginibacter sp.]